MNAGGIGGGTIKANLIVNTPNAIYGVEGDILTTATLTRTDDAADFGNPTPYIANATNYGSPFDNIMPWSGMERVTDSNAGELVKIPKFWFKLGDLGSTGANFKLQIANCAADGFSVAPAFMDRGDGKGERDFVYVGRYPCSAANYKSETSNKTIDWITRATARTNIHALGANVWQWDYAMLVTIQMLYLVEYATWDINTSIGAGSYGGGAGGTDAMPYHTGTIGATRTARAVCQYRYIEDLWHTGGDFVDGINLSGANVYSIKNPANFSDDTKDVLVGVCSTSSGWVSAYAKSNISEYEWFYFPSAVATSADTHILAYCYNSGGDRVLIAGGTSYSVSPFSMSCDGGASYRSNSIGSRLMVLP